MNSTLHSILITLLPIINIVLLFLVIRWAYRYFKKNSLNLK
ncbi:MAG: hypothetical protein V4594_24155 [Bacteroidota bacterium]